MAQTYTADVPDGTTNIQDNQRNNEHTEVKFWLCHPWQDSIVTDRHGIEYIYDGATWVGSAATNTLGLDVAAARGH